MRGRHHGVTRRRRSSLLWRTATSTLTVLTLITVTAVVVVTNVDFGRGASGAPRDRSVSDLMTMAAGFRMDPVAAMAEARAKQRAYQTERAAERNAKIKQKVDAQQAAWNALKRRMSQNPTVQETKQVGRQMNAARGWSRCWSSLETMWNHESGWDLNATNPQSGAYGIAQSLPADKMASAGPDWRVNAMTQISWGLGYIAARYGDPCRAWDFWQANGWY